MTTDQASQYGSLIGVFLMALFAQWNAHKANKDRVQIKRDLKITTDEHMEKLDIIHTLINGDRLLLLEKVASLARRLALHTNDEYDKLEADRTDKIYHAELLMIQNAAQEKINKEKYETKT